MGFKQDYDKIVYENFNIMDKDTRKIMISLNEADQNQALSVLTSKLYNHIVDKVDDIDYGDIPSTKGDITKLYNYEKLTDCIGVLKSLLIEYKQDPKPVLIIEEALKNIVSRRELFEKAFKLNVEMPIVMYSTICLSIISSTSFLVATCIEFIKTPTEEEFGIILDKVALNKTKQNLLFSNLQRFNKACDAGQIDTCFEMVIKKNIKQLTGIDDIGIIAGSIALVGLILNILPIMRELVFFFYYSRVRVSDYFDIQADLLQMNAYNVESNSTLNKDEKKRITNKQMKIVELFRKISNKLAISNKESETKATKEITSNNKKYKADEVFDSVPDSASSALF